MCPLLIGFTVLNLEKHYSCMYTPMIWSSFRKSLVLTTNVHALCGLPQLQHCATTYQHTKHNTQCIPNYLLVYQNSRNLWFFFREFYCNLLLLRGRHQRHCPAHKSRNLVCAVWLILTMQYQQKPSKVSAQLDVGHGATINHLMLVRSCLLRDLWHSGCGLMAWYSTQLHLVLYQPLDHTPRAINLVTRTLLTNIKVAVL